MIKKITSIDNPLIKELSKLDKKKERELQQRFVAEGIRTIATLVQADYRPLYVFTLEHLLHQAAALYPQQDPIVVNQAVLNKISYTTSPSGVTAIFALPQQTDPIVLDEGFVCVGINNPGNLGTLIRSCAAMNKKVVVTIDGVDPYHPKAVQASAGTLGFVTLYRMSWAALTKQAHYDKVSLCALIARDGKSFNEVSFSRSLLVLGEEAQGLPAAYVQECQQRLTLAMPGNTESFNVAIAGSIAAYLAWSPDMQQRQKAQQ